MPPSPNFQVLCPKFWSNRSVAKPFQAEAGGGGAVPQEVAGGGGMRSCKRWPEGRGGYTMPHPAQGQHTNHWASRTRKRHQQEHRPQQPTESNDPTQHAKGRTGDFPGPRKGATTRRNVTQGGGGAWRAAPRTSGVPCARSRLGNSVSGPRSPGQPPLAMYGESPVCRLLPVIGWGCAPEGAGAGNWRQTVAAKGTEGPARTADRRERSAGVHWGHAAMQTRSPTTQKRTAGVCPGPYVDHWGRP